MSGTDTQPTRGGGRRRLWWRRFVDAVPLRFALLTTAAVWAMGCVWSFREQTLFAQTQGFGLPWLLPAVIDGLAIALACVAYAASLDGRPGAIARLGTALAVAASATSNATFAWQRSGNPTTVVIAAGVPVAANLAFEVLLHELRRQTLRRRGLPAPVAVPYPRLIRIVLAPVSTLRQWRRLVLDLTALHPDAAAPAHGVDVAADGPASQGSDSVAATRLTTALGAVRARASSVTGARVVAAPVDAHMPASGAGASASRRADGLGAVPLARSADAAALAARARQSYRVSLADGAPLTGRQLGQLYNRSASWGRERIGEVKAHDRKHRPVDARAA